MEKKKKLQQTIAISPELRQKLREKAYLEETSMSKLIEKALWNLFDSKKLA